MTDPSTSNGRKVVLRLEEVHLQRGVRQVLRGVSFEAVSGELVIIMGASGSGKTTVLRACAGLEPFHAGRITVGSAILESGATLSATAARVLHRQVGMVFQFHCLFEHLSAIENVCLAPVHAHGVEPREAVRRGLELLSTFGVEHRSRALPRELSGGEAQRVAIARALAVNPPVLLMDEPTASLDAERRNELGELLQRLLRQDRTLVVATHDEDFARDWATRVLRIEDGIVIS